MPVSANVPTAPAPNERETHDAVNRQQKSSQVRTDDASGSGVNDSDEEADDDGPVGEEPERDKRVSRSKALPDGESDDRNSSADEERDAVAVGPVRSFAVGDRDGDQDHTETGDKEEETEEVKLPEDGLHLLPHRTVRALLGNESSLDLLADLRESPNRQCRHWEQMPRC